MLKNLAFRVAALLLATSSVALGGTPASAAGGGTLFGITGFGQSVLSTIDPVGGSVTPVEDLAGPQQGQIVSFTGDPIAHRIYALREITIFIPPTTINVINQILTINSDTGGILATMAVNNAGEIAFDPTTDSIYQVSQSALFRVDPATGKSAQVASIPNGIGAILSLAVVPGTNTVYIGETANDFTNGGFIYQLVTVNTATGATTETPVNTGRLGFIAYDAAAGLLLAADTMNLYSVDPASGNESVIQQFNTSTQAVNFFAMAFDPTTNTAYLQLQIFDFFNPVEQIVSINDLTASVSFSPNLVVDQLESLYFQPAVTVTAASTAADVQSSLASGQITKSGMAQTLLSDLSVALAAHNRGQCKTASNIYQQFIADVSAQAGKAIATATASRLTSEAEYLQANCP